MYVIFSFMRDDRELVEVIRRFNAFHGNTDVLKNDDQVLQDAEIQLVHTASLVSNTEPSGLNFIICVAEDPRFTGDRRSGRKFNHIRRNVSS